MSRAGYQRRVEQLDAALEQVLRSEPKALADLDSWWARERALRADFKHPGARAVVLAAECARLGLAFAGGFRAALVRMSGELDPHGLRRMAFCATERGGAHPRSIATTLEDEGPSLRVRGEKTWATLGEWADELLVVCLRGTQADGRPELAVVRVAASHPGVERLPARATPFCPEITHCGFRFDALVPAEQLLPGDGYADYLKPFRTVEDCHVQLAICAYLLGVARRFDLGAEWQETWCGALAGACAASELDPRSSVTHTLLAGLERQIALQRETFEQVWRARGGEEWACWERDRGLLRVAQGARDARSEAARRQLAPRVADPHP
ncbi:MAG: acyl-CoA dehydrogenase family protein [Polyangiaceae bacterium]